MGAKVHHSFVEEPIFVVWCITTIPSGVMFLKILKIFFSPEYTT